MMWVIVLSFFMFSAVSAEYTFETKYIDVPIDHYSFTTDYKFPLRYLVNDTFHDGKGPIFFYCGNEGFIELFAQNTGFMFDIAPQFNALIVFAEHRYYGESLPFGNDSFISPKNLGYLGVTQALADFVYLINDLQKTYTTPGETTIPAVAFGGSYGGGLAAWLKMKFPHSIIGAIASSAPIWTYKGQNPCNTFYVTVTEDYRKLGGENVVKNINASWSIIRSIAKTSEGKAQVSKLFNLCSGIESDSEVDSVLSWLNNIYSVLAELNYPYETNFGLSLPANPVQKVGEKLNFEFEDDTSLLTAIGEIIPIYTNNSGTATCNEFRPAESQIGDTAYGFQTCTELIVPFCSQDNDMFENYDWNFEATSDWCFEAYGVRPLDEEVPILQFGGKDLSTAINVIFSNGLYDPWSGFGILANYTPNMLAVVMPDTAHHLDLRSSNKDDPDSVITGRQIHVNNIAKWLNDYFNPNITYHTKNL